MAKILLVTGTTCGGSQRMTILYGKIFEKAGHNVEILFLKNSLQKENPLLPFVPKNWKIYTINCRHRWLFIKMAMFLRKCKHEYIFSSLAGINSDILLLKKLGLVSCNVIVRNNNMPDVNNKLVGIKKKLKLLLPLASSIIAQTDEMKNEMVQCYRLNSDDVIVINNPIDTDFIKEKIKEDFSFDKRYTNYVAVARIVHQKDYDTMLRAFAIVHGDNPMSRLYIIGNYKNNDKYYQSLQTIIKNENLSDSVFFVGLQNNPYKYMKAADCFCLSSEIEGLPNVMLEAMYLGIPVAITESIPFIKQTIQSGKNGYSCPIHDYHSFADCMKKAAEIKVLPLYITDNTTEKAIANLIS